jgi:hypothetical protein
MREWRFTAGAFGFLDLSQSSSRGFPHSRPQPRKAPYRSGGSHVASRWPTMEVAKAEIRGEWRRP